MFNDIYPFKLYFLAKRNIILFFISFLLNTATWVWLFTQIKPQEDYLFLHYNILFGVDYVGDWWKVVYVPATGLAIFMINMLLGWIFYGKDKFAATLLNVVSVYCQIFLFVAASLLVFLNV